MRCAFPNSCAGLLAELALRLDSLGMTASKKLGESIQGTAEIAAEPSLDQRLRRLEAIVAELEGGGVVLEEAIERYQEGVLLLKECRAVLSVYRRRVEELSQNAEESVRAYTGDPDAG